MNTRCVHDWDFTDDVMFHLVCLKCGYKLEDTDIINHMTMLESDSANTREVWNECEAALAETKAMVERLIEEGNLLAERVWEKWCWEWDALVAEYRATVSRSDSVGGDE